MSQKKYLVVIPTAKQKLRGGNFFIFAFFQANARVQQQYFFTHQKILIWLY